MGQLIPMPREKELMECEDCGGNAFAIVFDPEGYVSEFVCLFCNAVYGMTDDETTH